MMMTYAAVPLARGGAMDGNVGDRGLAGVDPPDAGENEGDKRRHVGRAITAPKSARQPAGRVAHS